MGMTRPRKVISPVMATFRRTGIFNKALASITSAERDAIYARWVRVQFDTNIDPTIILIVILVSALVVSVIILRNRKIRLETLNKAREELERRVIERTAELDIALKTQEKQNTLLANQNEELARIQEELQTAYDGLNADLMKTRGALRQTQQETGKLKNDTARAIKEKREGNNQSQIPP